MDLHAEKPGRDYDAAFWEPVRALYEEAFPGLTRGIDAAASIGFRWQDVTTPFALFEGDRCVAHVGVLSHPMRLQVHAVSNAGIHAVGTAADYRRRGLCRDLLGRALAWADGSHSLAKLHTDVPEVYAGHGFKTIPTWRFRSAAEPVARVQKRPLRPLADAQDAALLRERLHLRAPVSERCASADDGWMLGIVAALSGRLDDSMWWLPEHETIAVFGEQDGATLVVEVIADALPPAEVIAGGAPRPEQPLLYTFDPDRIEPGAQAIPSPATGAFMVRGEWPPFSVGLSPLWEH